MYELVILRADYEGWWLFEDWREKVIASETFTDYQQLKAVYEIKLAYMRDHFSNEVTGKHNIHAFYSNCEIEYCADCEEEMQIYYSVIVLNNDKILRMD